MITRSVERSCACATNAAGMVDASQVNAAVKGNTGCLTPYLLEIATRLRWSGSVVKVR